MRGGGARGIRCRTFGSPSSRFRRARPAPHRLPAKRGIQDPGPRHFRVQPRTSPFEQGRAAEHHSPLEYGFRLLPACRIGLAPRARLGDSCGPVHGHGMVTGGAEDVLRRWGCNVFEGFPFGHEGKTHTTRREPKNCLSVRANEMTHAVWGLHITPQTRKPKAVACKNMTLAMRPPHLSQWVHYAALQCCGCPTVQHPTLQPHVVYPLRPRKVVYSS